jgi:transcriptional regulator with GAF, ATPase, and Fis domain
VTTIDSATGSLVLQLGRTRAATMDLPAVLSAVCTALPSMVGVAGAVILLADPADACYASDAQAGWIGEAQRRSGSGPLPNALRSGRPAVTSDLTRIGPPELAAAADQCGLISSVVLLLEVDGERLGGLQLLGDAEQPLDPARADLARPVAEVLAARLADHRELQRLREARLPASTLSQGSAITEGHVDDADVATTSLAAVPAPRAEARPAHQPGIEPQPVTPQRRPRHSRPDGPSGPADPMGDPPPAWSSRRGRGPAPA